MQEYIQDLNEILLSNYIDSVYEGINLDSFKDVFKKIGKEISSNFKFVSTFGMVITLFFPLVDNLMRNMTVKVEITPQNIVLATIGAVAILLDSNKDKLKWILQQLKEKEWETIINDLVSVLKNIKELFSIIAKQLGKVIKSFASMLSYTLLFVPFLKAVLDYVQNHKLEISDLSGMALSVGSGVALIAGQNILEYLINELSRNRKLKLTPDLHA